MFTPHFATTLFLRPPSRRIHNARLGVTAHLAEQTGVVFLDLHHVQMLGSQGFLEDGQGLLKQRLGRLVAALSAIQPRQVVEAGAYVRVLGSQGLLGDGQGALKQRFGCLMAPLSVIQRRQVVEAGADVRVLGSQSLLVDG